MGERIMKDKGNCFCGKEAFGMVGIPLIKLTESLKAVNIDEEGSSSSVIVPLCPYHLVFAERGFLKSDGNNILKPEPFLEFEGHTDECLKDYLKNNKGKKGIRLKRFMIDIVLSARQRERVLPEFLKRIEGKTDILELMKIGEEMFKVKQDDRGLGLNNSAKGVKA